MPLIRYQYRDNLGFASFEPILASNAIVLQIKSETMRRVSNKRAKENYREREKMMNRIELSQDQIRVLFKILSDIKFESLDKDYDKYVYSPIFNELLKNIGEAFYENFKEMNNPFQQKVYLKDKWKLNIIEKRLQYLLESNSNNTYKETLESVTYPFSIKEKDK